MVVGGSINAFSTSIAIVVLSCTAFVKMRLIAFRLPVLSCERPTRSSIALYCLYCALIAVAFVLIVGSRTTASSLGPWEELPSVFLAFFFLASALLFSAAHRLNGWMIQSALVIHTLMATTLALIMYPLGYGFDPFLHHAAEKHIATYGSISPLPLIYGGHYAFMVFVSKISGLPVALLDQMLVPLLVGAAPLACWVALKRLVNGSDATRARVILLALAVPYPYIIITTPWSFAILLVLLLVCRFVCSFENSSRISLFDLWLFTFAVFFVHPLAGIPAFFFTSTATLLFYAKKLAPRIQTWFAAAWLLFGSFALALALTLYAAINHEFTIHWMMQSLDWSRLNVFSSRFDALLDPTYLWSLLSLLVVIILASCSVYALIRCGTWRKNIALISLVAAIITLGNAFILRYFIAFSSLVSYERGDYSERLVHLAILFIFPLAAFSVARFAEQFEKPLQLHLVTLFITLLAAGIITAGLYLSYPRNDAFASYHGVTVSAADSDAVRWIHNDAKESEVAILANQVSAAAAIREYGFYRYYSMKSGEQFYYSIPASSQLHAYFMQMASRPEPRVIDSVRALLPVSVVYFILHDYEPRFELVADIAARFAVREQSFGDGAVRVFVYEQ